MSGPGLENFLILEYIIFKILLSMSNDITL